MNKHVPVVAQFATVEGRALAAALKPLLFVVESRNTYPILGMVKLQLDGTQLRVSATDLDIDISTSLDVNDCAGEWSLCVEARTLAGIARVAGPMLMRLERVEGSASFDKTGAPSFGTELKVTLDDGAVTYTVANVTEAGAFPVIKGDRGGEIERFGNGLFPSELARVERVISREETRYYLNGVCWTIGDRGRWFAATDGHRLLKHSYSSDKGPACQRIIPRKAVELFTRLFAGDDAVVYDVDTKLDIEIGGYSIRLKLIEGTYPDIDRVIPKSDRAGSALSLPLAELNAAIVRACAFPGKRRMTRAIRFFGGEDGRANLDLKHPDWGSAHVTLSAAWPEGLAEFGLDGKYLPDLLRTCEGTVTLGVESAGAPILVGDGDGSMTRVIMPMRV